MKNLIFVFFFVITNKSFSQIDLGIKGGVNLASFVEKNKDITQKNYIGAEFGLALNWVFSKHFSIETGIDYSMKGTQAKTILVPNYSINAVHYLQMPFSLVFLTGTQRSFFRFEAGSGIYLANLLSAQTDNLNLKNLYYQTDFGTSHWIGVRLGVLSNDWLVLRTVFSRGFVDITKTPSTFVQNQVVKIQLIWFFPL